MRRLLLDGRYGRKARFFAMALMMVVGMAVMGALVMLLWNWLMPVLFPGAAQIDYGRAIGLLLLCKLLLSGGHGRWQARRQHWDSMTPEERAQFSERFKSRWGGRFGSERWDCAPPRAPNTGRGPEAASGPGAQGQPRDAT